MGRTVLRRRTKDYAGLESAGLVVGPLVHGAVLVTATREPVANNEVVISRYRSICTQLCTQTIWPTLPCHSYHVEPASDTITSQRPRTGPSVSGPGQYFTPSPGGKVRPSNTPFQLRNRTRPPRRGRQQTATEHFPSSASNATQRNSASAAKNSIEFLLVIRWILLTRLALSTAKCCGSGRVVKPIPHEHLQTVREQVYDTGGNIHFLYHLGDKVYAARRPAMQIRPT